MEAEELIRSLAETRLCGGLPEAALARLAEFAELRRFGAGEMLFHEGAYCGDLFLVRQGKVQLQMRVPGRGSVPILTLGPGQLVAWSAVLGTGEMTASALAPEATEALVVPGARLRELCEQDHDFGHQFMERLAAAIARRLVATRLQLLDLFASDAPRIPFEETQCG